MAETNIHYAFQICDIANREVKERICGPDRTLLSKKSFQSLITSISNCIEKHNETFHIIRIFNDRSTPELISFVQDIISKNTNNKIKIEFCDIKESGIANSIQECYYWLQTYGVDYVYQVQDDYLFRPSCITEMYELQLQLIAEIKKYPILSPFNDFWLWSTIYRNKITPRTVILTHHRYWIQYYDMSCSFMTHHSVFSKHWDLYHLFFQYIKLSIEKKVKDLENKSLNYMLSQRGELGFVPIETLGFHLQSELEEDPFIDWRPYWDNIDVT